MKSSYDIIKTVLHTEKSTLLGENRQYCFLVARDANKLQIKQAIEDIYKVGVSSVRTLICPGKLKKVRYQPGYTADQKKAIVTLEEGQKIELT